MCVQSFTVSRAELKKYYKLEKINDPRHPGVEIFRVLGSKGVDLKKVGNNPNPRQ